MEPCKDHSKIEEWTRRSAKTERDVSEIGKCLERLTTLMEQSEKDKQEQAVINREYNERLTAVEMKPATRWENVVGYVFAAIIALAISILGSYFK